MDAPIKFKFQFLNNKGKARGMLRTKGTFNGQTLVLGKQEYPAAQILHAESRFDRLVMAMRGADGAVNGLGIVCGAADAKMLARVISRASTGHRADQRRAALRAQGREHEFVVVECPHCKALVDLSGFADSPQAWCYSCDTLFTRDGTGPADERQYHLCESCGFFAQPQNFTEFYFYFLLVVYGFRYSKHHFCHTCMRSKAWTMFGVNLPFLLGVPVAVTQLGRAYFGGSSRSATFKGLDKANALAKKRKADDAVREYESILARHPMCAGIYFNQAFAHAGVGKFDDAIAAADNAMLIAANYIPARDMLAAFYEATKREDDLKQLIEQWPKGELDAEANGADSAAAAPPTRQNQPAHSATG